MKYPKNQRILLSLVGGLIVLFVGVAVVVDRSAGSPTQASTADLEAVVGSEAAACKARMDRAGSSEIDGRNLPVVLVGLADLKNDREMTQIWRNDAGMLSGVIADDELQFLEQMTALSTTALQGAPVILEQRAVDKAVAQGETEVLAHVFFLGQRNVADLVVSTDANSFYSFCGMERYGDSVARVVAMDPSNAARAMAAANLELPVQDDDPTEAEIEAEMIEAWLAAPAGERSFSADVLPPEIEASLVPIEIAFDLPDSWVRADATLCLRTRVAWLACTALNATNDEGQLARLNVQVPEDFEIIEVFLNDLSGSYVNDRQRVVGEIRPVDLSPDRGVLLDTKSDFVDLEEVSGDDLGLLTPEATARL